jgi:hypothetical protein
MGFLDRIRGRLSGSASAVSSEHLAAEPRTSPDWAELWPEERQPIYPGYQLRFGPEISALNKRYVPEYGACAVLQGELVRAVDKLWFEGQDNGNINWDRGLEYFVDLLEDQLLASGVLPPTDQAMATRSLLILRLCGREAYANKPDFARHDDYAELVRFYPDLGERPADSGDMPRFGYVHDDLYRHLMDCVAIFAQRRPEPIPYSPPGWLQR